MTFKDYIKKNWDGWPLHSLVAGTIIWAGYRYPMETLLAVNTLFWPDREATQHYDKFEDSKWGRLSGYANIWTPHRIMEWGCPMLVGFAAYGWIYANALSS